MRRKIILKTYILCEMTAETQSREQKSQTPLACVREVPDSNLGPETGNHGSDFP